MKALFACGGTAGHVNPAVAIADLLKKNVPDFCAVFVGTPNGIENRLVPAAGYEIRHVPVLGLRRSLSPRNLRSCAALFRSFGVAGRILKEETPDLVLGTGGYVCYPVLRAASKRGIPTVLHESNAKAGIAARLLARRTDLALINFPSAERDFRSSGKTVFSGNPLREEFYTLRREEGRKRLGLKPNDQFLVVFGGSLGAKKLNEAIEEALPRLLSTNRNLRILHAVGKNGSDKKGLVPCERYERREYIEEMPTCLTAADLVVCRAGAMTLSEIAAAGVPSILVPFPAATGDHQTKNASAFADAGAAILLPDALLSSDRVAGEIERLLSDPAEREKMRGNLKRFFVPDSEKIILREIRLLCPKLRK